MAMSRTIPQEGKLKVRRLLARAPSVMLTGPRQVVKTTLALEIAEERKAVYLDLERPSDRAKFSDKTHTVAETRIG